MEWGVGDHSQSMAVGKDHTDRSDRISGESNHNLNPFVDSPSQSPHSRSPVLQEIQPNSKCSLSISMKSNSGKVLEPENMIQWRKDRQKFLDEQDAAENCGKEEMANLARSQYETWFENYRAITEKIKTENREANQQFMKVDSIEKQKIGFMDPRAAFLSKEYEEEISVWEYVAKLCDLSPNNRCIKSDVNRMRQLMLQLKAQKFLKPINKTLT